MSKWRDLQVAALVQPWRQSRQQYKTSGVVAGVAWFQIPLPLTLLWDNHSTPLSLSFLLWKMG